MNTIQTPLQTQSESRFNRDFSYHQLKEDTIELSRLQQIVYDTIRTHTGNGGITDQDIASITGISLSSVNGRRNELMKRGMVVDDGSDMFYDDRGICHRRTLWKVRGYEQA